MIKTVEEHYRKLIQSGHNTFNDPPILQHYMDRWTQNVFWELIGDIENKSVLEIGVGDGRIAKSILDTHCQQFTGIDIVDDVISLAKDNLINDYPNCKLLQYNIIDYPENEKYEIIISVLTFMHIENKKKVFQKIYDLLKRNGKVVISFSNENDFLNMGDYRVKLFPFNKEDVLANFEQIGFNKIVAMDLKEENDIIATIIKAEK